MNTTKKTKNEIISNLTDLQPCCKVAFLSAVFRSAGSLVINSRGLGLSVSGENQRLIGCVAKILRDMYGIDCSVEHTPNPIKNNEIYGVEVRDTDVLREAGILLKKDGLNEIVVGIDPYVVGQECCVKNFLRGLFVGCGTVTLPMLEQKGNQRVNAGYHVEFFLSSQKVAQDLVGLLSKNGFRFKIAPRAEGFVVYAKDSSTLSDLLAYLGANKTVIDLQTLLIEKIVATTPTVSPTVSLQT